MSPPLAPLRTVNVTLITVSRVNTYIYIHTYIHTYVSVRSSDLDVKTTRSLENKDHGTITTDRWVVSSIVQS